MSDTRIEDFTLPSTGGDFTLSAASRPLVIYFYPKDSTPGCTTESAAFRDLHAEFTAAGATVVGISRDSLKSHQNRCPLLELTQTLGRGSCCFKPRPGENHGGRCPCA